VKLGFPRALTYYDYYPFWAGFFHKLGVELVTSPLTNREIMELGLKNAPDETCLPVKILVGHLKALKGVDGIFLPRLVSMEENTYLCPKILGLPESVLGAIPKGCEVYTVDINWRAGSRKVLKELERFGLTIGCTERQVRSAFSQAQKWLDVYQRMRRNGWEFRASMECFENLAEAEKLNELGMSLKDARYQKPEDFEDGWLLESSAASPGADKMRLRIALIGHSYLTYESYANLNLLERLQEKAELHVVENIDSNRVDQNQAGLRKKLFWSHARKIYGAGGTYVDDSQVDGLIFLSCFGCGTDSMTNDLLARRAREVQKPYMVITLDEHSGEAGLVTRLEAFLDMLERGVNHENHVSPYGEFLDRHSSTV
jgi:predicted nucleotide-binding protein (sugar kinase/HSP70/actin superfamily)